MIVEHELQSLVSEARDAWEANAVWWAERMQDGPGGDALRTGALNETILSAVPPGCSRILDLACGEGYLSRMLARADVQVTALDWSLGMMRAGQASSPSQRRISWIVGDSGLLPCGDGEYDFVLCSMAAMDIVDIEQAFGEARRVVRRSGEGLWTVLDPDAVKSRPEDYLTVVRREARSVPLAEWAAWVRIASDQPLPTLYAHRSVSTYTETFRRTGWAVQGATRIRGDPLPSAIVFRVRAL